MFIKRVICMLVLASLAAPVVAMELSGKLDIGEHGALEIRDIWLTDQLVHGGSGSTMPLRLNMRYNVTKTGDAVVNSRFGSNFWHYVNYTKWSRAMLHSQEDMDLRKAGEAVASVERVNFKNAESNPGKGLCGIRGRYYFLIDQPDHKQWKALVRPPRGLQTGDDAAALSFTLANLTTYSLDASKLATDWQPGSPLRVQFTVTDADGETFPVVNVKGSAQGGNWKAGLKTEEDQLFSPTGWMICTLPDRDVPETITIRGTVSAMGPDGHETREIAGEFQQNDALPPPTEAEDFEFARTPDGRIRETRAIWVYSGDFNTPEKRRTLIAKCKRAHLNVLMPDIFVDALFLARSDVYPAQGSDALGELVKEAHKEGLEVHAWFCDNLRRPETHSDLGDVRLIRRNGSVAPRSVDLHRKEYRDFLVDLMVDVADNYDVDGIHHDYIRVKSDCYCDRCKEEYEAFMGKPMQNLTDADRIKWHSPAVFDIVERVTKGVRQVNPDAVITAACVAYKGGPKQGQDGPEWVRRDWIDLLIMMGYDADAAWVSFRQDEFLKRMDEADRDRFVSGVGLFMPHGNQGGPRPAWVVKQQIEMTRRKGIRGYCLFDDRALTDEIIEMLAEINEEPAVPWYRSDAE